MHQKLAEATAFVRQLGVAPINPALTHLDLPALTTLLAWLEVTENSSLAQCSLDALLERLLACGLPDPPYGGYFVGNDTSATCP